jgi:predicted esterase
MNEEIQHLHVRRTARILIKKPSVPVNSVWIALHGYGMDVKEFAGLFDSLVEEGVLMLFPEGLSRFYREGHAGPVVASWMTRESRETEISDYLSYLDQVYDHFTGSSAFRVQVFGYSQGASAASRWVMSGNRPVDSLILWSGEFAPDITEFRGKPKTIVNVAGNRDEFISLDRFKKQTQYIESKGFDVKEFQFDGGHRLDRLTLKEICRFLK